VSAYELALHTFCQRAFREERHAETDGLSIYSNNHLYTHISALEHTYPLVQAKLGNTLFRGLAAAYNKHFSANFANLNLYGEQFSLLLGSQIHGAKRNEFNWFALSRLAEIEYAISLCYYSNNDDNDAEQFNVVRLPPLARNNGEGHHIHRISMLMLKAHYPFLKVPSSDLDGRHGLKLRQKEPYVIVDAAEQETEE